MLIYLLSATTPSSDTVGSSTRPKGRSMKKLLISLAITLSLLLPLFGSAAPAQAANPPGTVTISANVAPEKHIAPSLPQVDYGGCRFYRSIFWGGVKCNGYPFGITWVRALVYCNDGSYSYGPWRNAGTGVWSEAACFWSGISWSTYDWQ